MNMPFLCKGFTFPPSSAFITLLFLFILPTSSFADGTVTVLIGNGIGSYNAAVDDMGSWGPAQKTAPISTKPYRAIYPNLNDLPGDHKIVTSASWHLYYFYDADYTSAIYSLFFYNGCEGDSGGTPFMIFSPWYGAAHPSAMATKRYYSFPLPVSLVQKWIDSPSENKGLSFNRQVSAPGTLVFGALDHPELNRRPYLQLTYSYTGDIAPQQAYFTEPTGAWQVNGNVQFSWDFFQELNIPPSTFTVQIDINPSGGSWHTIANAISADKQKFTWNTAYYPPGNYSVRIRSQTSESVYSEWSILKGQLTLTDTPFSIAKVNNLVKVEKSTALEISGGPPPYSWFAAKGEGEALQLVLVPHRDLTNVEISISPLSDNRGNTITPTLYIAQFVECTAETHITGSVGVSGHWPDALVPTVDRVWHEKRNAAHINIKNYSNQPFYIDTVVPINQQSGVYTGSLVIKGNNFVAVRIPLRFTVRKFSLPATANLRSQNLFDPGKMNFWHRQKPESKDTVQQTEAELWTMYRDFLLQYRMSIDPGGWTAYKTNWDPKNKITTISTSMDVPYFSETVAGNPAIQSLTTAYSINISWPTYDNERLLTWDSTRQKYIPNPKVHIWDEKDQHYLSPEPPLTKPSIEALESTCKAAWRDMVEREWIKAGIFYVWDEPHRDKYDEAGEKAMHLKQAAPAFQTLITSGLNQNHVEGQHSLAFYDEWIDIWVPVINFFGNNDAGAAITTLDSARKNGDEVWAYTSNMSVNDPHAPAYFIDMENGMYARIMPWLAWLYNLNGLLYFDTAASWKSKNDPYHDIFRYDGNGDGTLWYPGATGIIGGKHGTPVPSVRLNYIRDGFEDWEYLKLLKDQGKTTFINQIIKQLFPMGRNKVVENKAVSVRNWVNDPELLQNLREQMANEIERNSSDDGM